MRIAVVYQEHALRSISASLIRTLNCRHEIVCVPIDHSEPNLAALLQDELPDLVITMLDSQEARRLPEATLTH